MGEGGSSRKARAGKERSGGKKKGIHRRGREEGFFTKEKKKIARKNRGREKRGLLCIGGLPARVRQKVDRWHSRKVGRKSDNILLKIAKEEKACVDIAVRGKKEDLLQREGGEKRAFRCRGGVLPGAEKESRSGREGERGVGRVLPDGGHPQERED